MRLYRVLLRLYPASFRAEYGDELCRVFAERRRHASGAFAPLATACAAFADVLPNALGAHAEILRQDLGFAVRSLRRSPGFAVTAALVVALGVGANTAMFSLADFVFVRPLPFADADRLFKLWQGTPGYGRNEVSPANYRDWRQMATSFSGMAAYATRAQNLVGTGEPRELQNVLASPELFPLLGVTPLLGRAFTTHDLETGPCVMLSHALWRARFGADPHVVGTTIRLDGVAHTITGIMPASFRFPYPAIEAWSSLELREDAYTDRTDTYLQVLARLKSGVTAERAKRELALVSAQLELSHPEENKQVTALLFGLRDELSRNSRTLLLALCGAALCILLLACANLASLFLARGSYRAHELAVRAALGAGRERIVRQLVTESLGVACVGGLVGVAGAAALLPLLSRLVPSSLPAVGHASLDLRVLVFAMALVLVTGFAFGLLPALRAGRASALDALHSGARASGGRTQRLRASLVLIEITAAVVLLIPSGLLIRAVWRVQAVDPGFAPAHVLTLRTALPVEKYLMTERRGRYYAQVLEQVRGVPGVESAAFVSGLPLVMRGGIWPATTAARNDVHDQDNRVGLRFVTPQYFATLGIPLRRGRDVSENDTREQPYVAVVSESFVRRHWPNEDALGRRFKLGDDERQVVGVVGDVRVRGLEWSSEPQVYLPAGQVRDSSIIGYTPKVLVVRTRPGFDVAGLLPLIRRFVHAADPEQPISDVRSLASIVAEETAPRVTQLWILGALAALALVIAGLGVNGLLTYTVAMRSREFGIRRALGADARQLVALVLREGVLLSFLGVGLGAAIGYGVSRGLGALLVDVQPGDPLTIAVAAGLCLVTALVGCLRPTLEATRVDPLSALRAE